MGVRVVFGALLWLLLFTGLGACGATLESRALTIDDLPACGLTCLFLTVPASGCALSDVDCQCKNEELKRTSAACLLVNCTMAESLDTSKVQADLCAFSDGSKTNDMYIYTIATYSIAVLFVTLRIFGKILAKRTAMDDWVLMAALIVATPPVACVLIMAGNGFGEHLWNLQHGQLLQNLRLLYVASSLYTVALGLIKVSLCMFYLQIFPSPRIRMVCYAILTWIVVNTLVIFLLTIFSCTPIRVFWNQDVEGKCMDISALAYANSASAIAQDVVLVVLPLICIRRLNMKRYRKVAVALMFSIGTFGCVTTMVRLHTLLSFGNSIDPTWDYVRVTIWTELELACGFVCASLPAVRVLVVKAFPKTLLTSMTSKSKSNSRSAPTSGPGSSNAARSTRKRFSWMHISTSNNTPNALDNSQHRTSRIWHGTSPRYIPKTRSHKRLSSGLGNYADFDMTHVRTCTPPVPPSAAGEESDQMLELNTVPAPRRKAQVCNSCGPDEVISALPRIGCLPDEDYSKGDGGAGAGKVEGRWWEEVRRSVEQSRGWLGEKGGGV